MLVFVLQFSDVLVYGSRLPPPSLQFKVHGQLALCTTDVSDGCNSLIYRLSS